MSGMTYRDVVRLLELIDTSECVDLDLRMGDLRLKVTRSSGPAPVRPLQTDGAADATTDATKVAPSPSRSAEAHPGATPVRAPMGGVFYTAPAPGQPPYVSEGQAVKAGDQLGIVEVMKLFTAITAPCDGVVISVLVDNQDTVGKDDVLMLIEVQA